MDLTLKELDEAVVRKVSPMFCEGTESIDLSSYERELSTKRKVDVTELRTVLEEAMRRFTEPAKSDRWLGPRVHAALRLTRQEAASAGVWRWLGLGPSVDYIRWRFTAPDPSRFVGTYYLHGLGRLWWMAELFRDGEDYTPAELALSNQDIPQNLLRMDIAHFRPMCQAFLRVPSRRGPGFPLTGREANALAKAANCAATTVMFDAVAPDVRLDAHGRVAWVNTEIDITQYFDSLPSGPEDPRVPETSITALTTLLTEIFAGALVRQGKAKPGEDEGRGDDADPDPSE